jgi:hypothetical protein
VTVVGTTIEVSAVAPLNASVFIVVTPSGNTASPLQLRPSLTTLAETTKLPPVEQLTIVLACAGLTLTPARVTSRLTIRVAMNLIDTSSEPVDCAWKCSIVDQTPAESSLKSPLPKKLVSHKCLLGHKFREGQLAR